MSRKILPLSHKGFNARARKLATEKHRKLLEYQSNRINRIGWEINEINKRNKINQTNNKKQGLDENKRDKNKKGN